MLTKIIENVKSAAALIGGIAAFLLFGWIYYLTQRVDGLKREVARGKAEKELSDVLEKVEEAKYEADEKEKLFRDSLGDYRRARDEYDGGGSGSK